MRWNVDSGAAVTVVPRTVGQDYPVDDKDTGLIYKNASGGAVADEGCRRLLGRVSGGNGTIIKGINARVADVTRGLLSVAEIIDVGGEVHFTGKGAWMIDSTHRVVNIERKGKAYEIEMELMPYADAVKVPGFGRQAGRP